MKFGEYLKSQIFPEWKDAYLDYQQLKELIKELEDLNSHHSQLLTAVISPRKASLTIPLPSNGSGGQPIDSSPRDNATTTATSTNSSSRKVNRSQEEFFQLLEKEMMKIESFIAQQVQRIRQSLYDVERKVTVMKTGKKKMKRGEEYKGEDEQAEEILILQKQVEQAGNDFLK